MDMIHTKHRGPRGGATEQIVGAIYKGDGRLFVKNILWLLVLSYPVSILPVILGGKGCRCLSAVIIDPCSRYLWSKLEIDSSASYLW